MGHAKKKSRKGTHAQSEWSRTEGRDNQGRNKNLKEQKHWGEGAKWGLGVSTPWKVCS